jgi:hypothetical protein
MAAQHGDRRRASVAAERVEQPDALRARTGSARWSLHANDRVLAQAYRRFEAIFMPTVVSRSCRVRAPDRDRVRGVLPARDAAETRSARDPRVIEQRIGGCTGTAQTTSTISGAN